MTACACLLARKSSQGFFQGCGVPRPGSLFVEPPGTKAADVVLHEGELQLDLLWTATSDDDCIMASGAFHNSNESQGFDL